MTIACCWAWLCGWSTAYGFRASLLDGNRDLSGGGVDGVFDEFLDDGSGSFDDLAGGDLGGAAREVPKFLRWGHGELLGESLVGSLPSGWKRAYSGVRFWRWWVSQGNRPSGSQDLMYPPRSAGAGFAFPSALALRMAVAR